MDVKNHKNPIMLVTAVKQDGVTTVGPTITGPTKSPLFETENCRCAEVAMDAMYYNTMVSFKCRVHGQVSIDRRPLVQPQLQIKYPQHQQPLGQPAWAPLNQPVWGNGQILGNSPNGGLSSANGVNGVNGPAGQVDLIIGDNALVETTPEWGQWGGSTEPLASKIVSMDKFTAAIEDFVSMSDALGIPGGKT
jgi:hypothetical protein